MRVLVPAFVIMPLLYAATDSGALAQDTSTTTQSAQSTKPRPEMRSPWSASLTSYVWFAGLDADVDVRNLPTAHMNVDFSEIFDKIDWAPPPVMLLGEVRYDRFALISDFIYLGVEDSAKGSGPLQVKADGELDTIVWTFGATYRAVQTDRVSIDLEAGGRMWNEHADLELNGPRRSRNFGDNVNWVDPIIGLVGQVELGHGFSLYAESDVGGFGVGATLDWQAVGTIRYQVSQSFMVQAGYRYLAVDYDKDGFKMDAAIYGPIIGGSVSF